MLENIYANIFLQYWLMIWANWYIGLALFLMYTDSQHLNFFSRYLIFYFLFLHYCWTQGTHYKLATYPFQKMCLSFWEKNVILDALVFSLEDRFSICGKQWLFFLLNLIWFDLYVFIHLHNILQQVTLAIQVPEKFSWVCYRLQQITTQLPQPIPLSPRSTPLQNGPR